MRAIGVKAFRAIDGSLHECLNKTAWRMTKFFFCSKFGKKT